VENINVDADVVIVGLGPTGLTLASLLGSKGHSVAVVERWPELYGKPRLTHIDGETARLINHSADVEHALRDAWVLPHFNWYSGTGQKLLDVSAGNQKTMLWDDHISVHQPHIEEALLGRIQSFDNVRLLRGYEVTGVTQSADEATVVCRPRQTGDDLSAATEQEVVVHGTYLVAADGAKSTVRECLGIERKDFGFNERWLCVDTEPRVRLPEKFDENAIQICDTARGYMFMPIGRKRQRFEFALLDDETTEEMQTPAAAARLLKQYHDIGAEDVGLIRLIVYTFECRLAKTWRQGRVFLAGDAAHTNPPYLGQGACSGLRDASNLAWKFDLVLRGLSPDGLLDSYEVERAPHVKKLMLDSRSLGKLANTRSTFVAGIRDLIFRFNLAPTPKFPVLQGGILARNGKGRFQDRAGTVPGQGHVSRDGVTRRLDDVTSFTFVLLARRDVLSGLSAKLRDALGRIGLEQVVIGDGGYEDTDGVYARLFDDLGADAMLLRPDFVLYGHSSAATASDLLTDLVSDLGV
jgi:3-(3-hydroxy-phenyl)propionate hydroxylase